MEYREEPEAYTEDMIPCPECGGEGSLTKQAGQVSMFDGIPEMVRECGKCKGEGEVKRWKRVNLWQSHDYFYDAEAVRDKQAAPLHNGKYQKGRHAVGSPKQMIDNPTSKLANMKDLSFEYPSGVNARNVWTIPTQGRSDAHFATFPDELPRRCILAGTSERGVCADCGAPWVRMVARESAPKEVRTNTAVDSPLVKRSAKDGAVYGMGGKLQQWRDEHPTQTLGWQPTCGCNADTVPATVLDPFAGSGTTLAVAQTLGRKSVGLDLNPEYLDIAQRYIGRTTA